MNDYGMHQTQYGGLHNNELYSMYRDSVYSKLSENEKLDLLQETVNRDALERGELGSPKVQFASMPANESGHAANGMISVNRDMAVHGVQVDTYNNQTIEHSIDDYNIQVLNTVIHENVHCLQEQINDGTVDANNPNLADEYSANNFTASVVFQNGSYKMGSQYLTGETAGGYYMYYFQATERDAYLAAEIKTNEILEGMISQHGTEPSFDAYAKSVTVTGYQAMEQQAIQTFQNTDFVKDLNQTLQNQYFGTNVPVDPAIERAVKLEMTETYQSMQQQISQGNHSFMKEETIMSIDSNVSREDVLKSSSEMAENNTGSVQATVGATTAEIDVAVDNGIEAGKGAEPDGESISDSLDDSESIDTGEGCEDGLDI